MYVCMHVCMYVCVYVCTYVCMCSRLSSRPIRTERPPTAGHYVTPMPARYRTPWARLQIILMAGLARFVLYNPMSFRNTWRAAHISHTFQNFDAVMCPATRQRMDMLPTPPHLFPTVSPLLSFHKRITTFNTPSDMDAENSRTDQRA